MMQFDLFISYAWTSNEHREWVRLLAASLHAMGFTIGIDADVDYGNDLNGFMRKISEAKHVLMIVDENYTYRADNRPDSGVAIENEEIRKAIGSKPNNWLAPLLIRNAEAKLPKWMNGLNLKYFNFRSTPDQNSFPGSEQVEGLWRWLAGLPTDKKHAISPKTIRKRMYRIERIDQLRDPSNWSLPFMIGNNIEFAFENAPFNVITLGASTYKFDLSVSAASKNSIYIYADHLKAIGLVPTHVPIQSLTPDKAAEYLNTGRYEKPKIGDSVILLNKEGCICVLTIKNIITDETYGHHTSPSVIFDYKILTEEG